jgi:hypothetical protein
MLPNPEPSALPGDHGARHQEPEDVTTLLPNLLASLASNPSRAKQAIRQLLLASPAKFLMASIPLVASVEEHEGIDFLVGLLAANEMVAPSICNPNLCTLEEAIRFAGRAACLDPGIDIQIMRVAWNSYSSSSPDWTVIARVLEILTHVSDGTRILPQLLQLMRGKDPKIRSKIALLVVRAKGMGSKLDSYLADEDHRLRANAIEALWGENSPQVVQLFKKATQDTHQRVIANAFVGLFLAGDPDAVIGIEQIASFPGPAFQASAAWAMGRCGDPAFEPSLRTLVSSSHAGVKRCALKALVEIHKRIAENASPTY